MDFTKMNHPTKYVIVYETCHNCNGVGIPEELQNKDKFLYIDDCKVCDGKGVIEKAVNLLELKRMLDLHNRGRKK